MLRTNFNHPFLIAGLVLLAPVTAHTDPNLNCDAYAGTAIAQHQQNVALGCGMTGARWSNDFAGHRAWCLAPATQMQNLTAEDGARLAGLAACAARAEARQKACQTYADRAVAVANAATHRACGFAGGRWSNGYAGHFNWCLGVAATTSNQEDQARANQFQGCVKAQAAAAARSTADACNQYAAIALNQQKENAGRGCGFTGGRWSGAAAAHRDWCLGVRPSVADSETKLRTAALQKQCLYTVCRTSRSATIKPPFYKTSRTCRSEPRPWR